jgi:hypothetical protein
MTEPTPKPPLTSVEADLFGGVFGFHRKAMTLLRQSSLDDEKRKLVADRIKTLLNSITAELKGPQQMILKERMDAAFDEVKRLVDELSGFLAGGNDD